MRRGEIFFIAPILVIGAIWILMSARMPYMSDGVPEAGYFPFWIGISVVALAALHLGLNWNKPRVEDDESDLEWKRPTLVAAGLVVCVAVLDYVGFGLAVGAYLIFLLVYLEKAQLHIAVLVGAGVTGFIVLMFETLLHVPMPQGPWGF